MITIASQHTCLLPGTAEKRMGRLSMDERVRERGRSEVEKKRETKRERQREKNERKRKNEGKSARTSLR